MQNISRKNTNQEERIHQGTLKPIEKYPYQITEIDDEDPDELIAVITAAITASMDRITHTLVVRSIRQIPSATPAWNRAARLDLTSSRNT